MTRARTSTGGLLLIATLVVLLTSLGAINPLLGIVLLGAGVSFAATILGPAFAHHHEGRRRLVRLIQLSGALVAGLAVLAFAADPMLALIAASVFGTPSAGLPYLHFALILVLGTVLLSGARWVREGYRRR